MALFLPTEPHRLMICWKSGYVNTSVLDCGLPHLRNGQVDASTGTTYNKSARYTCSIGYDLIGSSTQNCQANGQWSGSIPTCRPKGKHFAVLLLRRRIKIDFTKMSWVIEKLQSNYKASDWTNGEIYWFFIVLSTRRRYNQSDIKTRIFANVFSPEFHNDISGKYIEKMIMSAFRNAALYETN